MKIQDIFGLVMRIGGVAFAAFGLMDLALAGLAATGLPFPSRYGIVGDALAGLVWLVFGLIFALGADLITRLVYRRPPPREVERSGDRQTGPWA